jgi:site-specific recombinase XerD
MTARGSSLAKKWVSRCLDLPDRTSITSAVKKSGVRRKGGIHLLRHSFATHLIESGVELPVVQRLLGHASLMTTAFYLHVTTRRLGEVHSPLDLISTSCVGQ